MIPGVIVGIIAIIATSVGVYFFGKFMNKKCAEEEAKPKDEIESVSIISTRTGEETRILATYNFTIYSFLVIYKSGKREVIECKHGSNEFNELIQHINPEDMKKHTETTD